MNTSPRHKLKVTGILLGVFVLALVPRLLYVLQIETPPFSDEADYLKCAENLLLGNGIIMSEQYRAYRAPGYPVFLASILAWSGDFAIINIRAIQAVLGALLCSMTAFLAIRLMKSLAAGVLAGLAAAFFDELIFFTGQLLSETVYTFLLLTWLIFFLLTCRRDRQWAWYLQGLGIGILALVRPPGLLLALLPLTYALTSLRPLPFSRRRLFGLLVIAGILTAVLPWSVRNTMVLGEFVPITTNTGVNLYIGHNEHYDYWSTGNKTGIRQQTDLNEVEESELFTRLALQYIQDHPRETLRHTGQKFYYTFFAPLPDAYAPAGPDGPVYRSPFKPWPWFGEGRELRYWRDIVLLTIPWAIPTIYLTFLGLRLTLRDWRRWWPLYAVIVLQTLPYLIFFGRARFRGPLLPIFILFMVFVLMEAWQQFGAPLRDAGTSQSESSSTSSRASL